MKYTEVLAKVSFLLIKVPKLTNLRSRDQGKIGQIAYPQRSFKRLGIEILWYQFGKISQKTQGGVGI